MMVGSRQPRHGIARAKALGLARLWQGRAEIFFAYALKENSEFLLDKAIECELKAQEYKASAE